MMKQNVFALAAFLQIINISAGPVALRDDWPVCAWIGWDTRESFWSSADGTYPACSAACFSQPDCKSFSYTAGDCNLYDVNVQTNINWDISSPYLFWDRNCEIKFQSCNTKAYQAKFDSYFWSNTLSQDQCTNACVSDANCKSLAWGSGECYLYNVPTKGNMDGPGNYLFSDVGCFKSSTTTASTILVTSSTASSSTSSASSSTIPITTAATTSTSVTKTIQSSTTTSTAKQSNITPVSSTTKSTSSTAKTTSTTKASSTTTKASTTTSKKATTTTATTKKNVSTSSA